MNYRRAYHSNHFSEGELSLLRGLRKLWDFLLFLFTVWWKEWPLQATLQWTKRILEVLSNYQHASSTEHFQKLLWTLYHLHSIVEIGYFYLSQLSKFERLKYTLSNFKQFFLTGVLNLDSFILFKNFPSNLNELNWNLFGCRSCNNVQKLRELIVGCEFFNKSLGLFKAESKSVTSDEINASGGMVFLGRDVLSF